MTTYTFTGAVAYDRLGSSWRTAAGLRSVSVTDPATGLLPTNLMQAGVAVSWLTADANSRYSFTCDVPGVVVDFGAGAEALYANEVPGMAIAAGGATNTAIDARMKWSGPGTVYALNQQVISPNNDVVSAIAAHTSGGSFTPANWTLSSTFVAQGTTSPANPSARFLRKYSGVKSNFNEAIDVANSVNLKAGATVIDPVWAVGWNMNASFTSENTALPMFRIGMEGGWVDPNGNENYELHLGAYRDSPGSVEIRPISIAVIQGGDGGLGSPAVSFCASETLTTSTFRVAIPSGANVMEFGSSGWHYHRNVTIDRGASAPSLLTVGDGLNSGQITLNSSLTGVNQIAFQQNFVNKWLVYDANTASLYFRDSVNGVMALQLFPGAGATGQAIFAGQVKINGNVGFAGTAPIAKRATTADSTDLASVITLANALKADLIAYGLKS